MCWLRREKVRTHADLAGKEVIKLGWIFVADKIFIRTELIRWNNLNIKLSNEYEHNTYMVDNNYNSIIKIININCFAYLLRYE